MIIPTWGNDPNWRAYFSTGWFNHQVDKRCPLQNKDLFTTRKKRLYISPVLKDLRRLKVSIYPSSVPGCDGHGVVWGASYSTIWGHGLLVWHFGIFAALASVWTTYYELCFYFCNLCFSKSLSRAYVCGRYVRQDSDLEISRVYQECVGTKALLLPAKHDQWSPLLVSFTHLSFTWCFCKGTVAIPFR